MNADKNRQLVEKNGEQYRGWECSNCGKQFLNSSCALEGLTLKQIVHHFTTMRERAFAEHDCLNPSY
jgi:hypothetical protein